MFSQVSVCPQGMGGYLDPMTFLGVGVSGARSLLGWVCLGRWVPTPQTWNLRGWSHVLGGGGGGAWYLWYQVSSRWVGMSRGVGTNPPDMRPQGVVPCPLCFLGVGISDTRSLLGGWVCPGGGYQPSRHGTSGGGPMSFLVVYLVPGLF